MKTVNLFLSQMKSLRKERGLTQAELAKRAGMSQSAIAHIENSSHANLRFETVIRIAGAMNCEAAVNLIPREDVPALLWERSRAWAEKLVRLSSGSTAIELQLPRQEFIEEETKRLQKEILKKYRRELWQNP